MVTLVNVCLTDSTGLGAIQVLRNAVTGGGVSFLGKKRYEGVRFNIISVTRGWVGIKFPGKKRYVRLEWPPMVTISVLVNS